MTKSDRGFRARQDFCGISCFGLVGLGKMAVVLVLLAAAVPVFAQEKDAAQYGMGLIVNVPFPESEVAQVVEDVVQNGMIHGSKEYNKDEYITGAVAATSTRVFPAWTEGGKVYYKVRLKALDPRNFKDSSDVGTLAVRYVVQGQGDKNTILHIDARFVEDFRHTTHASNGSVESAEYTDIHNHLDAIDLMKTQTAEAQKEKQERSARQQAAVMADEVPGSSATPPDVSAQSTPQTLEQHVQDLRQQVERRVKSPGARLKAAPFHTASTLQALPAGTDVLIVILTPYWYGVETHEGQHGWVLRDELEFVP